MKINCLSCGHSVDLDEAYGDYQGEIRCYACGAVLELTTEQHSIKSVRLVSALLRPQSREGH